MTDSNYKTKPIDKEENFTALETTTDEIISTVNSLKAEYKTKGDELLDRSWIKSQGGGDDDDKGFTVMQFNLLAEGLSALPDKIPPLPHEKAR